MDKDDLFYNNVGELAGKAFSCDCGKLHKVDIEKIVIESNALGKLEEVVKQFNKNNIMLVADQNTYDIAGKKLATLVNKKFVFQDEHLIPDEKCIGRLLIEVANDTTMLIALGSGTINDIVRMISSRMKIPYIIVATAPSMDGYASVVSPLIVDSVKNTYTAVYPKGIVGDLNILKEAPLNMLKAGIGDVIGKYTALSDWKIANLIEDEYYCEFTASMVEELVNKCTENVDAVMARKPEAIKVLMDALVLSGLGIAFAGNSRPASGCEHLISHCWEMHFLCSKNNTPWLHGNKVGVGTNIILELYKFIVKLNKKDVEKSASNTKFDIDLWDKDMKRLYGKSANKIMKHCAKIANTHREKSPNRRSKVIDNWDKVIEIIQYALSATENLKGKMDNIGLENNPVQLGIDCNTFKSTLRTAKDLRDRYGVLQLLQDIGLLEEAIEEVSKIYY